MAVPRVMFGSYQLPYVFHISDPLPGIKNIVIEGHKGEGSIVVPGGRRSVEITVRGHVLGDDYDEVQTAIETLKSNVGTEPTTFSLDGGYSVLVRRLGNIEFAESLRNYGQEYSITFLTLSY